MLDDQTHGLGVPQGRLPESDAISCNLEKRNSWHGRPLNAPTVLQGSRYRGWLRTGSVFCRE